MDEYIKKIYFSDLELDNDFAESKEHKQNSNKMVDLEEELEKTLKNDELKLFEKYLSARNDYLRTLGEYNFIMGYKFGSRLMLETLK